MRRDLVIDGMIFGNATIEGNDSTKTYCLCIGH